MFNDVLLAGQGSAVTVGDGRRRSGPIPGRCRRITPKPSSSGTMVFRCLAAWRPLSVRPVSRLRSWSGRPFPAGRCPTHVPKCWEKSTAVAVKIKLKRLGKIREPYYRIVVADARTKRDGRAIEEIGKYHPKAEPSFIEVNSERVQHWLSVGAQPTDPVRVLLKITGDWQKFKGEPGSEGTLRTAEPRADKKERFETAAKESQATKEAKEDKGGRSGTQSRTTKPAKDAPAKESTAKKEAPAKEAKSSASP